MTELPEKPPECARCHRLVTIFESVGETSDGDEWVCYQPLPCRYCSDTNKLIGMRTLLGFLIEERDA